MHNHTHSSRVKKLPGAKNKHNRNERLNRVRTAYKAAKTWAITHKKSNALMHALNGNISSVGSYAKLRKSKKTCWSDGSQKKANPFGKDNKNNAGIPSGELVTTQQTKTIERRVPVKQGDGKMVLTWVKQEVEYEVTKRVHTHTGWITVIDPDNVEKPAPTTMTLNEMYRNAKKRLNRGVSAKPTKKSKPTLKYDRAKDARRWMIKHNYKNDAANHGSWIKMAYGYTKTTKNERLRKAIMDATTVEEQIALERKLTKRKTSYKRSIKKKDKAQDTNANEMDIITNFREAMETIRSNAAIAEAETQRKEQLRIMDLSDNSADLIIPAGTCWDCIPFIDFDLTASNGPDVQMSAMTKAGRVSIPKGPIGVDKLLAILEYYKEQIASGCIELPEFATDPEDLYAIDTSSKVWHLYREGYNNYTDLVEYDEDGEEIKMEEDDGTQTMKGLNAVPFFKLFDEVTEKKKAKEEMDKKFSEVNVGGDKDCWKILFMIDEECDYTRTLEEVIMLLDEALKERQQGANVDRSITKDPETGLCYICFEEECDCDEPEEYDPDGDAKGFMIGISWTRTGNLHIEGYRYMSSAQPLLNSVAFYDLKKAMMEKDEKFFKAITGWKKDFRIESTIEVGAKDGDLRVNSIAAAFNIGDVPETNTWKALIDSHDLRAAALALAKIDHAVYHLPGVLQNVEIEKMVDSNKGGWLIGANLVCDNTLGPCFSTTCLPEVAGMHMARQMFKGKGACIYNSPDWLDCNEYLPVLRKSKDALAFFTRVSLNNANITKLAKDHKNIVMVVPNVHNEMPAHFTNESGTFDVRRQNGNVVVVRTDMTEVVSHNQSLLSAVNTCEYIVVGQKMFQVTIFGKTEHDTVVMLNQINIDDTMLENVFKFDYNSSVREFNILMPLLDSLTYNVFPVFKMRKVAIDGDLLRTICAHNLQRGDLNFRTLLTRCVGYAHRRYHLKHNIKAVTHLTNEQLLDHAYLAAVMVRRMYLTRRWLVDLTDRPRWVEVATKHGMGAAQLALQAMKEGSSTYRNFQEWADKISTTSRTSLHDFTDQTVMNEVEAWMFAGFAHEARVHSVGNDKVKILCEHHKHDCVHKGANACACCGKPTDDVRCNCCMNAMCQYNHKCGHMCDGTHFGPETCDCCGQDSEQIKCKFCISHELNPEFEYEDGAFATKVKHAGGAVTQPTNEVGKPRPITTKDGVKAIQPVSPAKNMGNGKHCHECAKCGGYYTHVHRFTSELHPLFEGDCPHCEGNTTSKKTDEQGNETGHTGATETKVTEKNPNSDPTDKEVEEKEAKVTGQSANVIALINMGYSLTEISAIRGNVVAWSELTDWRQEGALKLPMIPIGTQSVDVDVKDFKKLTDIPDSETCGYEVLNYINPNVKLAMAIVIAQKESLFTNKDIVKIAEHYGMNVVLVSEGEIVISRNGDQSWYDCILATTPGHWEVGTCSITWKACPKISKVDGVKLNTLEHVRKTASRTALSTDEANLAAEISMNTDNYHASEQRRFHIKGNFFTNNKECKHQPYLGLVAVKHNGLLPNNVAELLTAETPDTYRKALATEWKHHAKTEVGYEIDMRMLNYAMGISACHNMGKGLGSTEMVANVTVPNHEASDYVTFDLPPDAKWMAGDMVKLISTNFEAFHTVIPVKTGNRAQARFNLPKTGARYKMLYPKSSYFNNGYGLATLIGIKAEIDNGPMEAVESECTMGVPGSGKTSIILAKAKRGDLIVTATSGNKNGVRSRLLDRAAIDRPDVLGPQQIIEKAAFDRKKYSNIFVDECTMFTAVEYRTLELLTDNQKNITLYGDDSQIGAVTMTPLNQIGSATELQRFVKPDNMKPYMNKSSRMGIEACAVASKVTGREVISTTGRHTVIKTYNASDPGAITAQIIKDVEHIDVILCFTRNTQKALAKHGIKVLCERVHGFQGREAKKIIVLQEKPTPGQDVSTNPRYTYSAFTRASEEIHWVSLGHNNNMSIENRLGKRGKVEGFVGDSFKAKVKEFIKVKFGKEKVELSASELAKSKVLDATMTDDGERLDAKIKDKLQVYAAKNYNATVTYETDEKQRTIINISRYGLLALSLLWDGKTLETMKDKFGVMDKNKKEAIMRALDEKEDDIEWRHVGQMSSSRSDCMDIALMIADNCRMLGTTFTAYADDKKFTIKATVTGLGEQVVIECDDAEYNCVMCITDKDGVYLANVDEQIVEHAIYMVEEAVTALVGKYEHPANICRAMKYQQMVETHKEILAQLSAMVGLSTMDIRNHKTNKYHKSAKKANITTLMRYETLKLLEYPDLREMYIVKDRKTDAVGWLTAEGKYIDSSEWELASAYASVVLIKALKKTWWYKIMKFKDSTIDKLKVGAINVTVKQMEEHFAEESNTATYIANRMGKVKAMMLKREPKPVTVVPGASEAWSDLLTIAMPQTGVQLTSVPCMTDINNHMATQIAIKMLPQWKKIMNIYCVEPEATLEAGQYEWRTVKPTSHRAGAEYMKNMLRLDRLAHDIKNANVANVSNDEARTKLEALIQAAEDHLEGRAEVWVTNYNTNIKGELLAMYDAINVTNKDVYNDEIVQLVNGNKAYIAIPTCAYKNHMGNSATEVNNGMVKIINNEYGLVATVPQNIMEAMEKGVYKWKNEEYTMDVMGTNMAVTIWKITKGKRDTLYSPMPYVTPQTMVEVKIPVINDNLVDTLIKAKTRETRVLMVDRRLYRSLSLRMMREGTTFEDLLVAARTMLHGVIYSPGGTAWKNKASTSVLMDTATAVYIIITKKVRNMEAAFRMVSDTMSTDYWVRTKGNFKNMAQGLLANVQRVLGMTLTENQLIDVLKASDSQSLRSAADYLDGWSIRVDEYTRYVRLGDEEWRSSPLEDVPKITEFALNNLLHWKSLVANVPDRELRVQHPPMKVKTINSNLALMDAINKNVNWLDLHGLRGDMENLKGCIARNEQLPSYCSTTNKVVALTKAITGKDYSKIKEIMGKKEVKQLGMRENVKEVINKLMKYLTVRASEYVTSADTMSLHSAISTLDKTDWKITKDEKESIIDCCLPAEAMDASDWDDLFEAIEGVIADQGGSFTRVRTVGRQINNCNIVIFAIGSRGDIRPAQNLALQLSEDGANVSLICPKGQIKEVGQVKYIIGDYDVEAELDKWHKIVTLDKDAFEIVLKDQLDNNWIRNVDYEAIPSKVDLVIGSAVSPQGLMYASAKRSDYVDFCPMPLRNIKGGQLSEIYEKLLSREYILLHAAAIKKDHKAITGTDVDIKRLIRRARPYMQACDAELCEAEQGAIFARNVGYWGGTNKFERKDNLRLTSNVKTIVTMGSMRDVDKAERMLYSLDKDTTLVLAGATSPLKKIAEKIGFKVATGNYDLSELPSRLTVVHHGGAGTTADLTRAGVWQVICPVSFDQSTWARRVTELRLGTSIRAEKLTISDVEWQQPARMKLPSNPLENIKNMMECFSASSGYSYIWNNKTSVFSTQSTKKWDGMLFDHESDLSPSVSQGQTDKVPTVTYDPVETYGNEKNTCGARTLNHWIKQSDEDLKLNVTRLKTTWADIDANGMDEQQVVNMAIMNKLNPTIYKDGVVTRYMASATFEPAWLWWQNAGHIVAIRPIPVDFTEVRPTTRPVDEFDLETVTCSEKPTVRAVKWPNMVKNKWHADLHMHKDELIRCIQNAIDTDKELLKITDNDRAQEYCRALRVTVEDRQRSGMARERRKNLEWIYYTKIDKDSDRLRIHKAVGPGRMLAICNTNGSYTMAVTLGQDAYGFTQAIAANNGVDPVGFIADPHTNTQQREEGQSGGWTDKKALNSETNAILGINLPILSNRNKKESDVLVIGYEDGYPHHWTGSVFKNYVATEIEIAGEIDEEFNKRFADTECPLRPAVYGTQKLLTLPLNHNAETREAIAYALGLTETIFGGSVVHDDIYFNEQECLESISKNYDKIKKKWTMPTWSDRYYKFEPIEGEDYRYSLQEQIGKIVGVENYAYYKTDMPSFTKFKLVPVSKTTNIVANGIYFDVVGETVGKSYSMGEMEKALPESVIFVRNVSEDALSLTNEYDNGIVFMGDKHVGLYTTDESEVDLRAMAEETFRMAIFVDNAKQAARWVNSHYWPTGGVGEYYAAPATIENPTNWLSSPEEETFTYKNQLADWNVEITHSQMKNAEQTHLTAGIASIDDLLDAIGLTKEDVDDIYSKLGTKKVSVAARNTPYVGSSKYYINGSRVETWRCDLEKIETNLQAEGQEEWIAGGLYEDGYPTGNITYRTDEINKYRNGNYTTLHNLNVTKADVERGIPEARDLVSGFKKLANLIVKNSGGAKHIIITANADWTPEAERKTSIGDAHYVNLTLQSRPQVGWANYVVPLINKYDTSLRQYRTLLWYAAEFDSSVQVTVVGGREDFTDIAKGMKADKPLGKNIIKHHKTMGGAQVYLNNATGLLGTLDTKVEWFASDMLHYSHLYGTDETLLCHVAANTIRLGRAKDFDTNIKLGSYPVSNNQLFQRRPNWWSEDDAKTVKHVREAYGLSDTDDNNAIATYIAKTARTQKGPKVDWNKVGVTLDDITNSTDGSCTVDEQTYNIGLHGLWIESDEHTLSLEKTVGASQVEALQPNTGDHTVILDLAGNSNMNIRGWSVIDRQTFVNSNLLQGGINTEHELHGAGYAACALGSRDSAIIFKPTDPKIIAGVLEQASRTQVRTAKPINAYGRTTAIVFYGGKSHDKETILREKCDISAPNYAIDTTPMPLVYRDIMFSGWHREDGSRPAKTGAMHMEWEFEVAKLMGEHSEHLRPLPLERGASRLSRMVSNIGQRKPLDVADILNEGNALRAATGPGIMSDVISRELDDIMTTSGTTWGLQPTEQSEAWWKKTVAFARLYQTDNGPRIYLRNRGIILGPMQAGTMQKAQSYDPTMPDDDKDDVDEGLWWQTDTNNQEKTGLRSQKYDNDKHLQMGYRVKNQKDGDVDGAKLVPWAIAIPKHEYMQMVADTGKPKYVIHHDELLPENFDEIAKKLDEPQLNGALKVYSRNTGENMILITYGRPTVDRKMINYHSAIMMSDRVSESDEQTREHNFMDMQQNITIVHTTSEMRQTLDGIRQSMIEQALTEAKYRTVSSTMEEMAFNQISDYNDMAVTTGHGGAQQGREYLPLTEPGENNESQKLRYEGVRDLVTDEIISMYENTDLTDNVRINAPMNKGEGRGFQSNAMPIEVIEVSKTALTPYPIESRPVLTKMAYGVENAVFNVLGSAIKYRKHDLNVEHETREFVKAYGSSESTELIKSWKSNPLYYDNNAMKEWLTGRTGIEGIDRELNDILSQGLFNDPINKLNVHVKLESLLKDNPITAFSQQQVRIIVWQKKGYAAMFSHVFLAAKSRLKAFLGPKVVYADGLTPQQLSNRVRNIKCRGFLEDDLTKQDRQTDEQTIACEMAIYTEVLGVHQDVVQLWRAAHEHWYFKGSGMKGRLHSMRHTGQATTAIGNVIVNLLVHRRLVQRLGESMQLMMVLGDDNLILSNTYIDAQKLRREIRNFWNMESKAEFFSNYGVFLRMIAVKNESGNVQMGPDFVRLRRRFEFTNGQNEAGPEEIEARVLSYGCMLGTWPGVKDIINEINPNVEPINWYDVAPQVEGVAEKYFQHLPSEHRAAAVHNEVALLMGNMKRRQPVVYKWNHFTTVEVAPRK
nr:polyprotein [Alphaendornavirus sp.]